MRHTRALAERLTYTDLRFTLLPDVPCILPPDLGSTLRGALGHALRDMSCPRTCPLPAAGQSWSCAHRALCAYSDWFEPVRRPAESPDGSNAADVPRGFIVRVPPNSARAEGARDPLCFTVRLFGRVAADASRVVAAVARLARIGLGPSTLETPDEGAWLELRSAASKLSGTPSERALLERLSVHLPGRATFELARVEDALGRCLWVAGAQALVAPVSLPVLPPDFADREAERVLLHLETPLWIRGSDSKAPSFEALRVVALRRIRDLAAYWHGLTGPVDPDDAPSKVTVETLGFESKRWYRFSTDQGRKVEQRGLTGTLVLRGPELGRHLWWLEAARALHLGKDTAFGLGRVRWSLDERETLHDGIDVRAHERGAGDRGLDGPARAAGDGGSGEPGPA
jgi:hypothetical protein